MKPEDDLRVAVASADLLGERGRERDAGEVEQREGHQNAADDLDDGADSGHDLVLAAVRVVLSRSGAIAVALGQYARVNAAALGQIALPVREVLPAAALERLLEEVGLIGVHDRGIVELELRLEDFGDVVAESSAMHDAEASDTGDELDDEDDRHDD